MTAVLSLWAWLEIGLVTFVGFFVQAAIWLVTCPSTGGGWWPGERSAWSGWWRRS